MPLYLDGKKRSDRVLRGVYDEMTNAFNDMSRRATDIDPHRPWRAANAEKLDRRPLSDWIAKLNCSRLTKTAIEEQFTNDAGQSTDQQSYLANLAVVKGGALPKHRNAFFSQTETLRCSEGNDALAKCLAADTQKKGGTLHKSTPVHAIDIGEDHVTIKAEGKAPDVFDHVVLAIPPSLWPGAENPTVAITPDLPLAYHVTMGTAGRAGADGDIEPVRRDLRGDRQPDRGAGQRRRAQSVCRRPGCTGCAGPAEDGRNGRSRPVLQGQDRGDLRGLCREPC